MSNNETNEMSEEKTGTIAMKWDFFFAVLLCFLTLFKLLAKLNFATWKIILISSDYKTDKNKKSKENNSSRDSPSMTEFKTLLANVRYV